MNLGIPDKIHQLLVAVGLFLLGFGFLRMDNKDEQYFQAVDQYRFLTDSLELLTLERNYLQTLLTDKSRVLSKKYNVDDPIQVSDSSLLFVRILTGSEDAVKVTELLEPLHKNYARKNFELTLLSKKIGKERIYLDEQLKLKSDDNEGTELLLNIGLVLFGIGLILWLIHDTEKPTKPSSVCHSCGKRFSAIRIKGINSDGTVNDSFCNFCYQDGKLTEPELSLSNVIERVKSEISRKNFLKRYFTILRIKGLDRWRKTEY